MTLQFPVQINADGLLPFLAQLDVQSEGGEEVVLDFSTLRRVSPAGFVALIATVDRWRQNGLRIRGAGRCSVGGIGQTSLKEITLNPVSSP